MGKIISKIISIFLLTAFLTTNWVYAQDKNISIEIVPNETEERSFVSPMWTVRYEFDHYDATYKATNDTKFYIGEFTVINQSYTQYADAIYMQNEFKEIKAEFTYQVSADANYKIKVIEVGTSTTVGGALAVTINSGFTYSTGTKVSPRKKVTITLYNKGVAVTGAKIYRMYDTDGSFLGYETRPDAADCWFPKLNSKTAVIGPEISI